jgi:hypothetical protein
VLSDLLGLLGLMDLLDLLDLMNLLGMLGLMGPIGLLRPSDGFGREPRPCRTFCLPRQGGAAVTGPWPSTSGIAKIPKRRLLQTLTLQF